MENERGLPEFLVEEIMTRIPFPQIDKLKCLSKCWQERFKSPSTLQEREKQEATVSFQDKVSVQSREWNRLYMFRFNDLQCFEYNLVSGTLKRIPNRHLPCDFTQIMSLDMEGGLLILSRRAPGLDLRLAKANNRVELGRQFLRHSREGLDWFVGSLVTPGKWKRLPRNVYPTGTSGICEKLLNYLSSDKYSFIAFCVSDSMEYCTQMYNSISGNWTTSHALGMSRRVRGQAWTEVWTYSLTPACLKGVLYILDEGDRGCLIAYDPEAQSWREHNLQVQGGWTQRGSVRSLLVCDSRLVVEVLSTMDPSQPPRLFQIDLLEFHVMELARGPIALDILGSRALYRRLASYYHWIYLGTDEEDGKLVVYNMKTNSWHLRALARAQDDVKRPLGAVLAPGGAAEGPPLGAGPTRTTGPSPKHSGLQYG